MGEHLTARRMNVSLLIGLLAACGVMLLVERSGVRTTLQLAFKGDIKRESQWLAQYGQAICTIIAMALIWDLDQNATVRQLVVILLGLVVASVSAFILKRLLGRVRPNREHAGRFLGPSLGHQNWRESFPSSHSACAVVFAVILSSYYPHGATVFWSLALIVALLRYALDAHWPSDVLAGIALGYGLGCALIKYLA